MPKKEEKNNKGSKKTTKTSTSKKPTTQKNTKKVVDKPVVTKVNEVPVVKTIEKEGNNEKNLINNTPFVICLCIIILLTAILIFVLCTKRVPLTSNGDEIVATLKGKEITANELYLSLKETGGKDQLLSLVDDYIIEKEVKITDEDKKYAQEIVDYYIEYAEYYETDLATFLSNYVGLSGISTEDEFYEFVLNDYKKTLAVINYIGEKASEDDLKNFYKENYSDTLTVKHILIEIDSENKDSEAAEKEAYNKAVKLIKKLNETEKDKLDKKFEELAEKNSDDTGTYANGGLIENFSKSDVVSGFYEASYELKDGEYTKEPVKTTYGYHIILKVSSQEVESFDKIKDQVINDYAENLLNSDANLYAKKWNELREQYKLSIKDDFIKKDYENSIKNTENTKTEE